MIECFRWWCSHCTLGCCCLREALMMAEPRVPPSMIILGSEWPFNNIMAIPELLFGQPDFLRGSIQFSFLSEFSNRGHSCHVDREALTVRGVHWSSMAVPTIPLPWTTCSWKFSIQAGCASYSGIDNFPIFGHECCSSFVIDRFFVLCPMNELRVKSENLVSVVMKCFLLLWKLQNRGLSFWTNVRRLWCHQWT